jgi:hypothetical protein
LSAQISAGTDITNPMRIGTIRVEKRMLSPL